MGIFVNDVLLSSANYKFYEERRFSVMKRFIPSLLAASMVLISAQSFAAATTTSTTTAGAANNMNPAQRAQIEDVVHQYLLRQPEVLVEALQVLQKRQFEQTAQAVKQTQQVALSYATPLFHQQGDPIGGNPNGTITIAEFFDYQCP